MVRNYKKKTEKQATTPRKLTAAVNLVRDGWTVRGAARQKGVCRTTLAKALKRTKNLEDVKVNCDMLALSYGRKSIFTSDMEQEIASYCIDMANMGFGLTVLKVRELAFEVASKNNISIPDSWKDSEVASLDWFKAFKKRQPTLSVRKPEGCSIARASAFNKPNVDNYFKKLEEVLQRNVSFMDGSRLFNLDETSTSTVQNSRKVVSPRGVKQLHQVKSAERGTSVTTCCIIGAHGIVVPPVMIFPRKYFKSNMLIDAFPGTLGLANEKGYMTKSSFVDVLKHFVKCTCSSIANPSLLLVDNVDTHLSGSALNYAKENGVTIFTFPPHCTHRLQPLDVGMFGPFKCYYDNAINSFMISNPGVPTTIYHVAQFVREALSKSGSPATIISSFEKTGIYPFNKHLFKDSDFIMSKVTEQPDPSLNVVAENNSHNEEEETAVVSVVEREAQPGPSNITSFITPQDIRGYPKAVPKESVRKPRQKGKCRIATDTPEKQLIESKEEEQLAKKKKSEDRKRQRDEKKVQKKKGKQKKVGRVLHFDSSSSEQGFSDSDFPSEEAESRPQTSNLDPKEGEYVLVVFPGKGEKCFVGKVIQEKQNDGEVLISFLAKTDRKKYFVLPKEPDLSHVHVNHLRAVMPKPSHTSEGSARRRQDFVIFEYDFTRVNLG